MSSVFGLWWPEIAKTLWILLKIVAVVLPLMISVAYLTFFERKVIGYMQVRIGPNRVGYCGLLQPIADALKLLFKEIILPTASNKVLFFLAPILAIAPAFAAWAVIPFDLNVVIADIDASLLYILAMTSIAVYGVIIAGWASNSKYAFLGALRSTAQMVSYEVSIGFIMLTIVVCCGSFNLQAIIEAQQNMWFVVVFAPLFLL